MRGKEATQQDRSSETFRKMGSCSTAKTAAAGKTLSNIPHREKGTGKAMGKASLGIWEGEGEQRCSELLQHRRSSQKSTKRKK